MNKKDFINKFKQLKEIKADESFKFEFHQIISKEIGEDFVIKAEASRLLNKQSHLPVEQMPVLQKILLINKLLKQKTMIIPIILIMALVGSGAGATYASQSSLPGEILYPVKIASEKVQTTLTLNDAKKAELYLKFSSKRLEEIEKLAEEQKADKTIIASAVANYQNELEKSGDTLTSNENDKEKSSEIAKKIADTTLKNKLILATISKKIADKESLNKLKEALEKAIEHNDVATLVLLENATSTAEIGANATTTEMSYGFQVRVINKIAEANHKISEAEKYIDKKEAKGNDITNAKEQINNAKTMISEAKNLLSQGNFVEAFLKAKEAHKTAQMAKKSAENKDNENGDEEEYNKNAFIINYILGNSSTTATSSIKNVKDIEDLLKEMKKDRSNNEKDNKIDKENSENDNKINAEDKKEIKKSENKKSGKENNKDSGDGEENNN